MTDDAPTGPAQRRAADRNRFLTLLVIFAVVTIGIVLLAIRDFTRPGPVGLSIWVTMIAAALAWAQLFRARKRSFHGRP